MVGDNDDEGDRDVGSDGDRGDGDDDDNVHDDDVKHTHSLVNIHKENALEMLTREHGSVVGNEWKVARVLPNECNENRFVERCCLCVLRTNKEEV